MPSRRHPPSRTMRGTWRTGLARPRRRHVATEHPAVSAPATCLQEWRRRAPYRADASECLSGCVRKCRWARSSSPREDHRLVAESAWRAGQYSPGQHVLR
eukprot:scaffold5277_cov404-Prasinococcus_capsulatus_cf.AAC.17